MNINQLQRSMPYIMKSGMVPLIWGHLARGKTEVVTKYFEDMNWLVFNFRLNIICDTGDMLGLADFEVDENGNSIATKFAMPDWLKKSIDYCNKNPDKGAVLFIDELNRPARPDLLGPIFQMTLEHKMHTVEFPKNLKIVCAANPNTDDYSVLNLTDKALLSRFLHLTLEPTQEEWRNWAKQKGYNAQLLEFMQEHPEALENTKLTSFSISDMIFPDRRKAGFMNSFLENGLPDDLRLEVFSGLIGIENAVAFETFKQKSDKPIQLTDILNNYDSIRAKVIQYGQQESQRTDILGKVINEVKEFYTTNKDFNEAQAINTVKFLDDLPADLMFGLLHSIYSIRSFHEFSENNYDLFKNIETKLKEIRRNINPESVKDIL